MLNSRNVGYRILVALSFVVSLSGILLPDKAYCQKVDNDVLQTAEDAFGSTLGDDSVGIYSGGSVRGFSPYAAGNIRIDGLYFDPVGNLLSSIFYGSSVRVGIAAQGYPFPAPTGIIDYRLGDVGAKASHTVELYETSQGSTTVAISGSNPINDKVGILYGADYSDSSFQYGGYGYYTNAAIAAIIRPSDKTEIKTFFDYTKVPKETNGTFYVPMGDYLPPRVQRNLYVAPSWATNEFDTYNTGLLFQHTNNGWTLRSGLFYGEFASKSGFTNIFGIYPDGSGYRYVVASSPYTARGLSGEVKASKVFDAFGLRNLFVTSLRFRRENSDINSYQFIDLGASNSQASDTSPKPLLTFPPNGTGRVEQELVGIYYSLQKPEKWNLSVGLQETHYGFSQEVNGDVLRRNTNVFLPSLSGGYSFSKTLGSYFNYTEGLEEAGSIPNTASNRQEILRPIRTKQFDIGIKKTWNDRITLISGFYSIEKPYITTNSHNYYGIVGKERHSGLEFSLSYVSPSNALRVLVGGYVAKNRVSGTHDSAEAVGARPVGQTDKLLSIDTEYTLPSNKNVSIRMGAYYAGSFAATTNNNILIPQSTAYSFGVQYKFKMADKPMRANFNLNNPTNDYVWNPSSSGVYSYNGARSVSVSLTMDF